jgi:hypothetical protein
MLFWLLSKTDPHLNSFNPVLVSETDETMGWCLLKKKKKNIIIY